MIGKKLARRGLTHHHSGGGSSLSLLLGDSTASYTFSDQTSGGRVEAFAAVCKESGTIEELWFRTNAAAATTKVILGIMAETAGKPDATKILGQGEKVGAVAGAEWVKVTGLSIAVEKGKTYFPFAMPIGATLHFNSSVETGGTAAFESAGSLGTLTEPKQATSWETDSQGGPVGFQALGKPGGTGGEKEKEKEGGGAGPGLAMPAVVVNGGNESSAGAWKDAAETGAKLGRLDPKGKAKAVCEAAKAAGMKVCWLIELSSSSETYASVAAEINALSTALQEVIYCVEVGNENWANPPGHTEGIGPRFTGDGYGKLFIRFAKEQREGSAAIKAKPLVMTTRLSPNDKGEWMGSMFSGKAAEIKTALIGNGSEAEPQNMVQSHCYGTPMNVKPEAPTSFTNYKGSGESSEWGSTRWMKEAAWVYRETGLNCLVCITEYGTNYTNTGYSSMAIQARSSLEFARLVKEEKVPSTWLPITGYKPRLAFIAQFSLYGNKKGGGNPYGLIFYSSEGGHNEEGEPKIYSTYKSYAEALSAAP